MTNRCPITYQQIADNQLYSAQGLKRLSPKLTQLNLIPFTSSELLLEAKKRAGKLSIQGIQPKLSARLEVKKHRFCIVDSGGTFIFKPQNPLYTQAPENEHLSMHLAALVGIPTPLHALLYDKEKHLVYCVKRFDRKARNKKVAVEDFAQLSGHHRHTKYRYSMEKLIPIIKQYTTFPAIECAELFLRTMVNYLIGNEDMHLKNFSLYRNNHKITLAPAYDFINSTIALPNAKEEIALPLNGKKQNLVKKDFITYFAKEKCGLADKIIDKQLNRIHNALPRWFECIENSFLNESLKQQYADLLNSRLRVLSLV